MKHFRVIVSVLIGAIVGAAIIVGAVHFGFIVGTKIGTISESSPSQVSLVLQATRGAIWGGILGGLFGTIKFWGNSNTK